MADRGVGVFENGDGDGEPCPHCRFLARMGALSEEAVMPLPKCPPLWRQDNSPCCYDCQAADTLVALDRDGSHFRSFTTERLQIWKWRLRQLRYPDASDPLVTARIAKPCAIGDRYLHMAWLIQHGLWYGTPACTDEAAVTAFAEDPLASGAADDADLETVRQRLRRLRRKD